MMSSTQIYFPASRQAGLDRLAAFAPRAGATYARTRNHVLQGHPNVSRLSPYIRYRLITEEEVLSHMMGTNPQGAAAKFADEVLWRSYWKGFLEMRPSLLASYHDGVRKGLNRIASEQGLRQRWEDACKGNTGIAAFDDWARELCETGYLHNHARMWFASIWIFTLALPWELGADFFLRHLIDGDMASNTLSWRWVAGLHTPGKTYLATGDNIAANTEGRYHPEGLATTAFPVQGLPNPPAGPCPQGGRWDRDRPTALLVHEDDLCPDFLLDAGLRPVQTAFVLAPEKRSPLTVAPAIGTFIRDSMADCAARLGAKLGSLHGPVSGDGAVDALASWAISSSAVQVVTPFAPRGPVADILDELDERLSAENIRLIRAMRDYDGRIWPQASKGFFAFRANVT